MRRGAPLIGKAVIISYGGCKVLRFKRVEGRCNGGSWLGFAGRRERIRKECRMTMLGDGTWQVGKQILGRGGSSTSMKIQVEAKNARQPHPGVPASH